MKAFSIIALSVFAAGPVLADDATTTPAQPKKVCRVADQSTGSIMAPKRICHTAAEWAAIDAANAQARGPVVPPPQMSMDALTPR